MLKRICAAFLLMLLAVLSGTAAEAQAKDAMPFPFEKLVRLKFHSLQHVSLLFWLPTQYLAPERSDGDDAPFLEFIMRDLDRYLILGVIDIVRGDDVEMTENPYASRKALMANLTLTVDGVAESLRPVEAKHLDGILRAIAKPLYARQKEGRSSIHFFFFPNRDENGRPLLHEGMERKSFLRVRLFDDEFVWRLPLFDQNREKRKRGSGASDYSPGVRE